MTSILLHTSRRFATQSAAGQVLGSPTRCHASIAILFGLVAIACTSPRETSLPYALASREEAAVREVLERDSTWRLAVESDSKNAAAIGSLRASDAAFTPYFARDTTRAGQIGFAFVLTRGSEFKVFYVRTDGPDTPQVDEVATMSWLDDGFVRLRGDSLDVAVFNSGEIVSFVWDAAARNMVLMPEEPAEDSDASAAASRPPEA